MELFFHWQFYYAANYDYLHLPSVHGKLILRWTKLKFYKNFIKSQYITDKSKMAENIYKKLFKIFYTQHLVKSGGKTV